MEDCFDDGHVLDRVFDSHGNFAAVQNGLGESIALERVLVADGKRFRGDAASGKVAAVVDENASWPVGRSVEWDFDFDASPSPQKLHPLVGNQLRAARKDRLTAGEIENRRRQAIDSRLRIPVDTADDSRGLCCESKSRCVDKVAAYVHQSASAEFNVIADVRRIDVEVAEEADDGAKFSDASFVEQLTQAEPLRVAADHEGFANLNPRTRANREQRLGFSDGQAERLLAENVFTCFRGPDGPGDVQLIGKGIVDDVDRRVGEEFFVRAVGRGNTERGRCLPSLRKVAGCDGRDSRVLALLHGGEDFLEADGSGAENSPAKFVLHGAMIMAGHVSCTILR